MKIFFSKYQLKKKSLLNAKDCLHVEVGALLKIQNQDGQWGVADLKPWPLLGDLTLEEELSTKGPLFRRSIQLATEDLFARKNKKSLLKNQVIVNNTLITDFKNFDIEKNDGLTLKIKASKNLDELEFFLIKAVKRTIKIRLDFNGCLDDGEFESFIFGLPPDVLKKIEYIEDPTATLNSQWSMWNRKVPLAIDFCQGNTQLNENTWTYMIIKPSRQNCEALIMNCLQHEKQFTITSSMDHPVGVAHGLRFAQDFPQLCAGFSTLELYESTEFYNYFVRSGNTINFSNEALEDYGIGMTKILEKLSWLPL